MSEEVDRLRAKKKQIGKTLTCQNCFHGVDPPEWVGLTKDEIMDIIIEAFGSPYDVAVDVQAKLKEKNT